MATLLLFTTLLCGTIVAVAPIVLLSSLWWAWGAHIILGWFSPILGITAPAFIKVLAARTCIMCLVPMNQPPKDRDAEWWSPLLFSFATPPTLVFFAWIIFKVAL